MAEKTGGRTRRTAGQRRTAAERRAPASPPLAHQAWEWVKSLAIAFVLFIIIRSFLVQSFYITSGSMIPTLLVGDFLLVNRAGFGGMVPGTDIRVPGWDEPERGDIVIFEGPHQPELDLVKRLVGLPGDTLAMRGGVLHVNGEPLEEPYAQRTRPESAGETHPWMEWQRRYLAPGVDAATYSPTLGDWGPIVVPPESYFMLGDNRDESLDSRFWGFVPWELIKGEAMVLYYSYDASAPEPLPWLTEIRWRRIGDVIR